MTPAIRLLKKNHIQFTLHSYHHDPKDQHFGDEAVQKLNLDPKQVFKTLLIALNGNQKTLAVAVTPVQWSLNLKQVAMIFNIKKVEMADIEIAQKSTGYLIGGISPLGQKKQLPTIIDSEAQSYSTIFISGGKRGLEIEINPNDLAHLLQAIFCEIKK